MKLESSSDTDSSNPNTCSSKSFPKNTEFSYRDDFSVIQRIKVYKEVLVDSNCFQIVRIFISTVQFIGASGEVVM